MSWKPITGELQEDGSVIENIGCDCWMSGSDSQAHCKDCGGDGYTTVKHSRSYVDLHNSLKPASWLPPEQQKQKDEQDLENKVVEALGSAKWRIEPAPDVFALRAFCAALKDVGYEIRKKY